MPASPAIGHCKLFFALEKKFLHLSEHPEPSFEAINTLAKKYQSACRKLIQEDTAVAVEQHAETRLWNAHSKAIARFHTTLNKLQPNQSTQRRDVARRKVESQYKKFLRSTSDFYRDLVQQLTSGFEDAEHVLVEARKLYPATKLPHLDSTEPSVYDGVLREHPIPTNDLLKTHPKVAHSITLCYISILRLGDLSRYRNTYLSANTRDSHNACEDLEEAKSLYTLSHTINLTSGTAHNSLSVIARLSNKPFETVVQLHHALLADDPEPMASGNLKMYYTKLLEMHSRGEVLPVQAHSSPTWTIEEASTVFALLMAMIHTDPPVENERYEMILEQTEIELANLLRREPPETRDPETDRLLEQCGELCKAADLLKETGSGIHKVDPGRKRIIGESLKNLGQVLERLGSEHN